MSENHKIKVGISMGDPNGVGIEIVLKIFEDKRMFDFFTPIVFADSNLIWEQRKALNLKTAIFKLNELKKPNKGQLNVLSLKTPVFQWAPGKESAEAGALAVASLKAATAALKKGEIDILVTAPLHKTTVQAEDFKFPGHTDYLATELGGKSLMFMVAQELRVALVSDHVPISQAATFITAERVQAKIDLLMASLQMDFEIPKPKIAILGINPHSGDHGVIGNEEETILKPLIASNKEKGNMVFGPYPADGFFGSQQYRHFDAVLAMYHDQGLIPFKSLTFGEGVNFTAGLTKVRTSPDHGTAFDIAGKGKADTTSFKEALFTGRTIFFNRQRFEEDKAH
ncbi:4-hydroxythreonine-4-phosphate dehydrogenase PdxA [Flavobacteriaceae bacterium]|jgi:4-hydroxythreonine-4-phosphate dehydrogenase|nr:4-hydroxythreonine-4-phosphate dehydrogenase PdxA [Flavobacteriaceae bacterium]